MKLILIGIGGFLGAISRYLASSYTYKIMGANFPYGTFLVNIIGCFLIGIIIPLSEERYLISPDTRSFIAIGFLGAFTTFSTFSFETLALFRDGEFWLGGWNIVLSLISCLLATWVGYLISKLF
jgi:CrcB protein